MEILQNICKVRGCQKLHRLGSKEVQYSQSQVCHTLPTFAEVSPKFSDTLTLFQPGGSYSTHHRRSCTKILLMKTTWDGEGGKIDNSEIGNLWMSPKPPSKISRKEAKHVWRLLVYLNQTYVFHLLSQSPNNLCFTKIVNT